MRILREAFFTDYDALCFTTTPRSRHGVADTKVPVSLDVPEIPRPEVYKERVDDTGQVPFDPVPVGVRQGLNAVKNAANASVVSRSYKHLVLDEELWEPPLAALEEAFKAGPSKKITPGNQITEYRDPRHEKAWPTLSRFAAYRALLTFIKDVCDCFRVMSHIEGEVFANYFTYGPEGFAQHIYSNPEQYGLKRTTKTFESFWKKYSRTRSSDA